jgi:hypothetical protein
MILSIDTDNNNIVFERFFKNPIQKIIFSRHNAGVVQVGFSDMPNTAIGSRQVEFAIKPHKDYNFNDFLVYSNSYVLDGSYFNMNPNFNVAAIQALFPLSAAPESILLSLQLRWSDDNVRWAYSNVLDAEVDQSIFMGGELSSFAISSFLDQIVPIMASFDHPINIFNNNLTVNNGSIFVSGSATGITVSGGSNYVNLSSANSWIYVNGKITSKSLSSDSITTPLLSASVGTIGNLTVGNIQVSGLNVANEIVGSLSATNISATNIYANTINALSSNIQVLNITQYELSGFNINGNVNVDGKLAATTLSAVNTITQTISATNAFVPNVFTNNLVLSTIVATSIKTTTLSAVNFTVNNITSVGINTTSLTATNITTNLLSSNFIISNNSFATNASVSALITDSTNTGFLLIRDNKFTILSSYTPTGTADAYGTVGTITYDSDRLYIKVATGWKRSNQFLNF